MTAITLNLLAEEQQAQQDSDRDPVKTAIAAGAVLVSLVACGGSILWLLASQQKEQMLKLQNRWETLSKSTTASAWSEFQAAKKQVDELVALNHARVLCAPQLAVVKDVIPDAIQLTRINFSLVSEEQQPAASAETGEDAIAKSKRPRPKISQSLVLTLDGKAVSSRPELEVDAFIQQMRNTPAFNDQVKQIQLRSIARSPVTEETAVSAPSVHFVIECRYKELP
jgi:hypothetical protein